MFNNINGINKTIFASNFLEESPDISSLEWIPLVEHKNRAYYEKLARSEGIKDFKFTEKNSLGEYISAREKKQYFPIFWDPKSVEALLEDRVGTSTS